MRFSQEFKIELKKAIKLSTFITVIVFGMVVSTYQKDIDLNRDIASNTDEVCPADEKGNPIPNIGRSVPPFERKPCVTAPNK
jgi:hypothetical protein